MISKAVNWVRFANVRCILHQWVRFANGGDPEVAGSGMPHYLLRAASILPFRFFGDGGCGTPTRAGSAPRGYVSVRVFGWLTLHPASELVEDPA